jgi:hypothetical protein
MHTEGTVPAGGCFRSPRISSLISFSSSLPVWKMSAVRLGYRSRQDINERSKYRYFCCKYGSAKSMRQRGELAVGRTLLCKLIFFLQGKDDYDSPGHSSPLAE